MLDERRKSLAERSSVTWEGVSGEKYTYGVYSIPFEFDAGQDGNYIYSKVVKKVWVPLYIGQGDLADRGDIGNHHQVRCLKSKGATHIHAHQNARKTDRISEEKDLLLGHPGAYAPTGCNEQPGG